MMSSLQSWVSRKRWRDRVITFDHAWFMVCMGSGILVQLCASSFPWQTAWLSRLGYCFWILDIVLFGFFSAMSMAKAILYPKLALDTFYDFQQTCYLGTIPIAWETIDTGMIIFYSDSDAAIVVAEVFFWIATAMSLVITCGGMYLIYEKQGRHKINIVTPVWLLLFIDLIVLAALGSNLAASVSPMSLHNAGLILTVSFLAASLGLGMSFLILGIYLYRLICCQIPAQAAAPSTFVPVGPLGMGAYVFANLGHVLAQYITNTEFVFAQPFETTSALRTASTQTAVAEMILWLGILIALFLLGLATFFLIEAFVSVILKRPESFTISLWAFVFPVGVYANGWCRVSTLLKNDGMKGWGAACVVCTALLYLMCAFMTIWTCLWKGELLYTAGSVGSHEKKLVEGENNDEDQKQYETRIEDENFSDTHTVVGNDSHMEGIVKKRSPGDGTLSMVSSSNNPKQEEV